MTEKSFTGKGQHLKSAACTVRAEDFYCGKKSIVLLIQRSAGWGEHTKRHCTTKWLDFVTLRLLSYGKNL